MRSGRETPNVSKLTLREGLMFVLGTLPISIVLGIIKHESVTQILARCVGVTLIAFWLLYGTAIAVGFWRRRHARPSK